MWTNVFKIGGFHQISWFQFLAHDTDLTPSRDKSVREEHRDAATCEVLSSHLQLQKEGFFSAWTNSFVGPWDPSQGLHNPDEKIKLWLFVPGRHTSIIEHAQTAVSRLRVIASGIWIAPGDSEEVATALSQALRHRIERVLMGLSYIRFGDVFSRYHPCSLGEELFRKGQSTIEFVFAATEDAIFVHVIIQAKFIRALSGSDVERVLKLFPSNAIERLPVVVSPHGMRGWLTGCCPSDLVKQVYLRSGISKTSTGLVGLPYNLSQAADCMLRGQNCYVEVTLGRAICESDAEKRQSNMISDGNVPFHQSSNSSVAEIAKKSSSCDSAPCEKTFIYPTEAVVVPVLQTSNPRSSLKRIWLQHWTGASLSSLTTLMHCINKMDNTEGAWTEPYGIRLHSFSNSNSSSISSISTSSSDSECKLKTAGGELEADADSMICRQSGLSPIDPMETDGSKQGAKRPWMGAEESFGQAGTVISASMQETYNNSDITRIGNDQIGSNWDWDDDDRGMGTDIQALLSEFGDFGDFFENDVLPFGEPPGTAESETLVLPALDSGDVGGMTSAGMMDVSEQMLSQFPAFDSFDPPPPMAIEECVSTAPEAMKSTSSLTPMNSTPAASAGEFDHILKAEALMTFAPEYGSVEAPSSEISSTLFKNPYLPKSREVESLNSGRSYIYGATPPPSPCSVGSDDKAFKSIDSTACRGKQDTVSTIQTKKYYTHVENPKYQVDRKIAAHSVAVRSCEGVGSSVLSSFCSTGAVKTNQNKNIEVVTGAEHLLLLSKTVPATELECLIFQASMCRMRHSLLSFSPPALAASNRLAGGNMLSQLPGDTSIVTDNLSNKYEPRKKESIPVRIAGDIDGGMLDGPLNSPVGVWRSVGTPKGVKQSTKPNSEVLSSLSGGSFKEETLASYGQRQPLQDLLDGLPFLVQQAASFVDVALDWECGDGPYGWLALQEQWRRGFCCGPHMVHAGCGGILASCHSLDIAGVELVDPLSADIQASSVISMLQSDVKTALKSAFGTLDGPVSVDGPLPVTAWCRGCFQSGDAGTTSDGFSAESRLSDNRDSAASLGDPLSPMQASSGVSSAFRDGDKGDDAEHQVGFRNRPTLRLVPLPSILVGYQDDWLKTSASSLQLWEKAPLEPYALEKHMAYYVVCPNIDPLTSAAADFFQQLGTVYEACRLGTHSPQSLGNSAEVESGKCSTSCFVLLDCPRPMKMESHNASLAGSISDFFLSLSNGWDMTNFLKSLAKALKALKLCLSSNTNGKEGNSNACTVIYVVCPFPDHEAILQTLVESSVAIGSAIFSSDSDRRSILLSQVGKTLSCSAGVDEASVSNIPALSGFSIPKIVVQIITVDVIFRVTSPCRNELLILKEIAFNVYSKARRISRGASSEAAQSSSLSSRSHSAVMQMANSIPGMWKDCVGPRISAPLARESELDSSLQMGTWNNTWQTSRAGGLSYDPNKGVDFPLPEELHYMFEPLFILAEPGSSGHGVSPLLGGSTTDSSKQVCDDGSSGSFIPKSASTMNTDSGSSSQLDGSESDGYGSGNRKSPPSLHCCYGWTEDWHWLVCIWTDSKGELLDSHIFPFGGISSRQDTKGMQSLFVQVLQQGCQILQACSSPDNAAVKPRDFVITRIGCFYELECQEWQKALYSIGGAELRKWPVQLRRVFPDGMSTSGNGASLQHQEMDRSLPSSPSPLYSPQTKSSGFIKASLGQIPARKQQMGDPAGADSSRGLLHYMQSISFVSVYVDHSLHLICQADTPQGGTQGGGITGSLSYVEGYTPVKSLGSTSAAYILIPCPSMRFLTPSPLQLPTCLTADSPPLAHLLHSEGSAIPLSTGFVVSKAVPSPKKDTSHSLKDEWPSVISVNLVDYYGSYNITHKKPLKAHKQSGRGSAPNARDNEIETHSILECVAAELHALSWMTVSPAYLERRTALPFHCDMLLKLRRLIHYAEKELSNAKTMRVGR